VFIDEEEIHMEFVGRTVHFNAVLRRWGLLVVAGVLLAKCVKLPQLDLIAKLMHFDNADLSTQWSSK
jgi:hypothetical protein